MRVPSNQNLQQLKVQPQGQVLQQQQPLRQVFPGPQPIPFQGNYPGNQVMHPQPQQQIFSQGMGVIRIPAPTQMVRPGLPAQGPQILRPGPMAPGPVQQGQFHIPQGQVHGQIPGGIAGRPQQHPGFLPMGPMMQGYRHPQPMQVATPLQVRPPQNVIERNQIDDDEL